MKTIKGVNMRKVEVKAYTGGILTGSYEGKFHGWGTDCIEYSDGTATGPFTAAIIEKDDGTVEMVCPGRMRFLT
jgi:hypothetical protein